MTNTFEGELKMAFEAPKPGKGRSLTAKQKSSWEADEILGEARDDLSDPARVVAH